MNEWENLERIIIGNWQPHLVEINSKEFIELAALTKQYRNQYSLDILDSLIDFSYPPYFNIKTYFYYWFIKLNIKTLKNSIQKISITTSNKEDAEFKITNQFKYACKLLEDTRIYKLRLEENPDSTSSNENGYIAGCCFVYLDLMAEELISYYGDIIPQNLKDAYIIPTKIKYEKIEKQMEALKNKVKKDSTELFNLTLPQQNQDEFLMRFYIYQKKKNRIDCTSSSFQRHFINSQEPFEKISWKKSVPLLKHTFLFLLEKEIINEPSINLDALLNQHFLKKNGQEIGENYLSQAKSRLLYDSPEVVQLRKELQELISNFSSNKI